MNHILHWRTSIELLLGLLLSRNCLVRRACPIERPACDRIKRRTDTFDAGRIRAAAISESRLEASERDKTRNAKSDDETLSQADLLFSSSLVGFRDDFQITGAEFCSTVLPASR
jgi:hypothetical protein